MKNSEIHGSKYDDKDLKDVRKLYPNASNKQLQEMIGFSRQYADFLWRNFLRVSSNDEEWKKFLKTTKKETLSGKLQDTPEQSSIPPRG